MLHMMLLFFLVHQNVVVFPSLNVAIENSLRLFSPAVAIVDEHLTRHLPKQWLSSAIEVHMHALTACVCHATLFA
jgi:methionine S-methyltransferase